MELRYENVAVGYQGRSVISEIDLKVTQGQRLLLVGPNGAGKSTLIKSMIGAAEIQSGTAIKPERSDIGYVPQAGSLDADFPVSAGQVVMMGRYRRLGWWRPAGRADRTAVRAALAKVGLEDKAGHRFGTLSGGQRQRVLLARAIVAEPGLLLLDEPFNGVDAVSQDAIVTVLRELSAAGAAMIISTHDLGLARDLADLVCLLNGRQWAVGTPGETLTVGSLRLAYGGSAVFSPNDRTVLVEQ
ncbi:manganese ABC transporter ATP-binding protein [Actinoplanes sp. OR16]|uniref:metal ABC transporter ATP-binding protein n=1 Tax=Actinoplanes sp. OR16 TaxID=946334 RepID=UPI000F6D55CA|nr:metal ABC transporter ATP-binding protein [Actinoplanes sp. OR16]BBH69295.1 manganese ABC transporter ATP-binding protein [Actinoplanes sp. OR16]